MVGKPRNIEKLLKKSYHKCKSAVTIFLVFLVKSKGKQEAKRPFMKPM